MTEVIGHLIFASLGIMGVWAAVQPDMILHKIVCWLDGFLPNIIGKPLYDCLICMSSFWGGVYIVSVIVYKLWYVWLILALAGLAWLTCVILSRFDENSCG